MCFPFPANYSQILTKSFTCGQVLSSFFFNIILENSCDQSINPSAMNSFVSVHLDKRQFLSPNNYL